MKMIHCCFLSQCILIALLLIAQFSYGLKIFPHTRNNKLVVKEHNVANLQHFYKSKSVTYHIQRAGLLTAKILSSISILLTMSIEPIRAIGSLAELQQQNMVIQDIAFNVVDSSKETNAFKALFENTCKELRKITNKNEEITVLSFGPDSYNKPENFYPGVSSFGENGGHATITVKSTKSLSEDVSEYFDKGNGLQYIKIGNDVLRLSKGIINGMEVKYAYGWVDIDSPNQVPLQLVVGITRDPIMMVAIRVNDIKQTTNYFTNSLGMKILPFPLARLPGSQYEPKQPEGSVYLSYGEDTLGILLIPSVKNSPPIQVGSLLNSLTIVYDDNSKDLPILAQKALEDYQNNKIEEFKFTSPDGYPFILLPFSVYSKRIL